MLILKDKIMEKLYIKRFVASKIDLLIVSLSTFILWILVNALCEIGSNNSFYSETNATQNIQYFISFLLIISFLYAILSLAYYGQLLGDSLLNLRVTYKDRKPNLTQIIIREIVIKWILQFGLPIILCNCTSTLNKGLGFTALYFIVYITINNFSWFMNNRSIIDTITGTTITQNIIVVNKTMVEKTKFNLSFIKGLIIQ